LSFYVQQEKGKEVASRRNEGGSLGFAGGGVGQFGKGGRDRARKKEGAFRKERVTVHKVAPGE